MIAASAEDDVPRVAGLVATAGARVETELIKGATVGGAALVDREKLVASDFSVPSWAGADKLTDPRSGIAESSLAGLEVDGGERIMTI